MLNDRPPNFRDRNGKLFLVRCYECDPTFGKENNLTIVATSTCAWCGWFDITGHEVELNKKRYNKSDAKEQVSRYDFWKKYGQF